MPNPKYPNMIYAKGLIQKADNGEITVIVSDETMDRSGESLSIASWDLTNFNKSPRMFVDHNYDVMALTGMWKNARTEDGKLKMAPVWHDLTEVARVNKELVVQGFLDTTSVGYIEHRGKDGKITRELLEVSWVGVPCNPNARVERLSIKSLEPKEKDAVEEFVKSFLKEAGLEEPEPAATEPEPAAEEPKEEPATEPEEAKEPEEKKGMIDDALAAAREIREQKFHYLEPMCMAWWKFVDAYLLDSVSIDAVKPMAEELAASLTFLASNPPPEYSDTEPMMASMEKFLARKGYSVSKEKKTETKEMNLVISAELDEETKAAIETMEKAGRVLSEKNRGIIQASLEAMTGATSAIGAATAALNDLLGASETSQGVDEEEKETPPAEPQEDEAKKSLDEFARRKKILKAVATHLSEALSQLKTPRI